MTGNGVRHFLDLIDIEFLKIFHHILQAGILSTNRNHNHLRYVEPNSPLVFIFPIQLQPLISTETVELNPSVI